MAEHLTNMALTAKEAKETSGPIAASGKNAPRFDWGLNLNLSTKSLEKLKISELPKVGSYVMVEAYCCVKSVRESEQVDGDKDRSVELQVESMMVAPAKAKKGMAIGKGYKKKMAEPAHED